MTPDNESALRALRVDLEHMEDRLESVAQRRAGNQKNTIAQVNVNAGGVGVAICVLCLVAILAAGGTYAFMANRDSQREFLRQLAKDKDQDDKIATANDYLQAIYAQAPQLRPKDPKQ